MGRAAEITTESRRMKYGGFRADLYSHSYGQTRISIQLDDGGYSNSLSLGSYSAKKEEQVLEQLDKVLVELEKLRKMM